MSREAMLLKNWTNESGNYSSLILEELSGFQKKAWTDLILAQAGHEGPMKVLDVGAGPGFFAIIMALAGHQVIAVDYTEAMIEEAKLNAAQLGLAIDFQVSDGQKLTFADESFDLIISRNVTWTLIDAEKAYREWQRVLRPGGRIIIFDANWNYRYFSEEAMAQYHRDLEEHQKMFPEARVQHYTDEMVAYRKSMPMCARIRPQWDFGVLLKIGFHKIYCDININEKVYDERQRVLYRSRPMFMLVIEK